MCCLDAKYMAIIQSDLIKYRKKVVLIQVYTIWIYRKSMQYSMGLIHKHFKKNETITMEQLRDILKTSRKVALILLKYLDMNKYTVV